MQERKDDDGKKTYYILGTGQYEPCIYHLDGLVAKRRIHIQEAIVDIFQQFEKPIEEFHILLTTEAKNKNWLGEEALLNRLKEYEQEGFRIKPHDITPEQNIDMLWKLFETIVNIMQKDDQIVFDITHSFRYQPMLLYYRFILK